MKKLEFLLRKIIIIIYLHLGAFALTRTVSGSLSCGQQDNDELLKAVGDRAILTSSSHESQFEASQVRLEGQAWCTRNYVHPGFDKPTDSAEWIQIDYGALYYFRGVLTKGRLLATNEFVERYRIEFKRTTNETWKVYRLYNGAEVMKGNDDSSGIELTALDPPLLARFIRIVPLQPADSPAKKICLHLGFYGCRDTSGYVSYSTPPGDRLGDALLDDSRYDGAFSNGTWVQGLGLLMDGQLEPGANPQQPDSRGLHRSVAWHNNGQPVRITFEFDAVRNFSSAIIHTSNEPKLDVRTPAFVKLEFSVGGIWYQKSVEVRPVRSDTAHPESIRIDLSQGTFGRFVRMTMLFASPWIAVNEVHFESVPASDSAAISPETTVTTTTSTTPSTTTTQSSTHSIILTTSTKAPTIKSAGGSKKKQDKGGKNGGKKGGKLLTTSMSIIDEELSRRLVKDSESSAESVDILAIDTETGSQTSSSTSGKSNLTLENGASVTKPGIIEMRPLSEEFIAIVVGCVLAVTLSIFVVILICIIRRRRIKRRHRSRGVSLESGGLKRPSAAFVYRPCALGPRGDPMRDLRSVLHDDEACMLANGSSGSAASTSAGPGSASPPHSTGAPDGLSANSGSAEKPYGSRQLLVSVNSDWTTTATSLTGLPGGFHGGQIGGAGLTSPLNAHLQFGVTVSPPNEQPNLGNINNGNFAVPTIRAPLPPNVMSPVSMPIQRPFTLQQPLNNGAPTMGTLGRWISPAAGRRWAAVTGFGTNVASPRNHPRPPTHLLGTSTTARLSAYDLGARAGAYGTGPCGNTLPILCAVNASNDLDEQAQQLLTEVEERFVAEIDPESLLLVETLGRGQFGEITICEIRTVQNNNTDTISSALVLVKRLFQSANEQAREQFASESRLLTILNHPNISLVVGQSTSNSILIHELPKLGDLVDLLGDHSGYLSLSCRLHLASQLASALRYMDTVTHMCHGDVGTRNCFVGVGLVLKLTDTAAARTRFQRLYSQTNSRNTRPVAVRWTAPEILLASEYSAKSDVFSFAVTLWELLAWGTVSYSPSPTEVLLPLAHLNETAVSALICKLSSDETYLPRIPGPYCPAELANLMEECWRADSSRRPSMSEVSMVLQRRVIGYNPDAEYRQLVIAASNNGGHLSSPEASTP